MTNPRKRKGNPQPIRFDKIERKMIKDLQKATRPEPMSVSEITRRSVRYTVPKFLSGEIPLSTVVATPPAPSTAST